MKSAMWRSTLLIPAIALVAASAFALPPRMAMAQASPGKETEGKKTEDGAAAPKPGGAVGGVVVQAPRPPSKLQDIPADKKAAFDEEAAKNEAWKRYRRSTPPLAAGALGQADDYPGLQSLLPQPEEAAPASPAAGR